MTDLKFKLLYAEVGAEQAKKRALEFLERIKEEIERNPEKLLENDQELTLNCADFLRKKEEYLIERARVEAYKMMMNEEE